MFQINNTTSKHKQKGWETELLWIEENTYAENTKSHRKTDEKWVKRCWGCNSNNNGKTMFNHYYYCK